MAVTGPDTIHLRVIVSSCLRVFVPRLALVVVTPSKVCSPGKRTRAPGTTTTTFTTTTTVNRL